MSAFSECLNQIKDRRNLTSADIAHMCQLDTTVVYKWIKGDHLPQNDNVIEKIADKLYLSSLEKQNLQQTYEKSLLGEEKFDCFQKIIEILELLHQRGQEYNSVNTIGNVVDSIHMKPLPEFIELNNKLEILQWIQDVLTYLMTKEEKNLYLRLQTIHQDVIMLLKMFCSRVEHTNIEEIVCFANESYGSTVYNLDIIKGLINMLVQKHPMQIYCQVEGEQERSFLDNWILSDEFFMEFSNDFSYGMLTTNPKMIAYYRKCYEDIKKDSQELGKKWCDTPESYLLSMDSDQVYFSCIEYMPCLGNCLTEEILEAHILPELPGREALIHKILQYNKVISSNRANGDNSFFSMEGLIEFMETGVFEVFPYEVYQRPNTYWCCKILENMIYFLENDLMSYHMVKEGQLPLLKGVYIELVEYENHDVEHLVIDIHFKEGKKERFEVYSLEIKKLFKEFFVFMGKNHHYVYDKEETLARLKEVLEEYRGKVDDL